MKKIYALVFFSTLVLSLNAQDTLVKWTFPTGTVSDSIANGGLAKNSYSNLRAIGTSVINFSTTGYPSAGKCGQCTNWINGNGTKYWQVGFTSLGFHSIKLSSRQQSGGAKPGPKFFKVQYRVGTISSWTDVPDGSITTANDWTTSFLNDIPLPSACEDADTVYLRWIMTSNLSSNGSSDVALDGVSKIDDIFITGTGISVTAENDTICNGSITLVSPVGEQASKYGIAYTWTYLADANIIGASSGPVDGQSVALPIEQILINSGNEVAHVVYKITPWVMNAAGGKAVSFPSKDVTVLVEPAIFLAAPDISIYTGSTAIITPASIQIPTHGIRYTWAVATNPNISGASASTGNGQDLGTSIEQPLTNSENSAQSVTYTLKPWIISGAGYNICPSAEKEVEVLIKPISTELVISARNDTICSGSNVQITPVCEQYSEYGKRYTWTVSSNSDLTGASSGPGGQSFEQSIEQTLINTSNQTQQLVYTITPWALNVEGSDSVSYPSTDVIIVVEPEVILTAEDETIESGGSIAITPKSDQSSLFGIRYSWEISNNATITGASSSIGLGKDLGTSIEQTLSNSSSSLQLITYTLTPYIIAGDGSNKCAFNETAVEISVNPVVSGIHTGGRTEDCNAWFAPAGNILHIQSSEPINQLRIFDLTGKAIFSTDHPAKENTIEIQGLRQGIYLVQLHTGNQVVIKRVIKQ